VVEGINEIRRGTMADALRAGRAHIERWSAADAGIQEISKCGLRGSPTIVKQVYAPSARGGAHPH
jgi:electron transfer flavoprotein beta subunit